MDRYLVHSARVRGVATHVIVIGVGHYPHLLGGGNQLTDSNEGMGQLTSPPISARRVAEWIAEKLRHPDKPLATVALLTSERRSRPFVNPRTKKSHQVEQATMDNVKQALNDWFDRGDASVHNRLIMYFCGHGLARGTDMALLMRDFGRDRRNALEGALDFTTSLSGLELCKAREQCFFIDACRARSETLLGAEKTLGRVVFLPDESALPASAQPRGAPVFYSTLLGQDAYSQRGTTSPFTNALLLSLDGAAGNKQEGNWRVTTNRLSESLGFFMKREFDRGRLRAQTPAANNLTPFDLHHIEGEPKAMVYVSCDPNHATKLARFTCVGRNVKLERKPSDSEWEFPIPAGTYTFSAEFATRRYKNSARDEYVGPVYQRVPLEVKP